MEHVLEQREFEKDGFIYKIKHIREEWPDLSYLGEFSDRWEKGAITHSDDPKMYRYFIPADAGHVRRDYERMLTYKNYEWSIIGVVAEIYLKEKKSYPIACSSGICGVESDSGRLAELEEAQIAEAEAELSEFKEKLYRA